MLEAIIIVGFITVLFALWRLEKNILVLLGAIRDNSSRIRDTLLYGSPQAGARQRFLKIFKESGGRMVGDPWPAGLSSFPCGKCQKRTTVRIDEPTTELTVVCENCGETITSPEKDRQSVAAL